jgi:hypothetical protein
MILTAMRAVGLVAVLAFAGCIRDGAFACTSNAQCTGGTGGTCETAGFCSFADPSCPDGRRFGAQAGSLSSQCVGASGPIDASTMGITVGGMITGLSGTVELRDNGGDPLDVSTNGMFTFASRIPKNSAYDVTVGTQPSGQACIVFKGAGTAGAGNVMSVMVACETATSDPGIACSGSSPCTAGVQECCFSHAQDTGTCMAIGTACGGSNVALQCTDAYDCGGGTSVCCATYDQNNNQLMGSSCKANGMCPGAGTVEIWCDPTAGTTACPSGKTCNGPVMQPPGPNVKSCH